MSDFWQEYHLIKTVSKNNRKGEEIRVARAKNKYGWYIDVRVFYPSGSDMLPGKGISIPEELGGEITEAILEGLSNGEAKN